MTLSVEELQKMNKENEAGDAGTGELIRRTEQAQVQSPTVQRTFPNEAFRRLFEPEAFKFDAKEISEAEASLSLESLSLAANEFQRAMSSPSEEAELSISPFRVQMHTRAQPSSPLHSSGYQGYFWRGDLAPRVYTNPTFSAKVFVGGVPWDILEEELVESLSAYGSCRVEWPGKEARYLRGKERALGCGYGTINGANPTKSAGYVYIIFDQENSVRNLLVDCAQQCKTIGQWFFNLKCKKRSLIADHRQVQIIPWVISDAHFATTPTGSKIDTKKTVFVGALHGMITAPVLFSIMDEVFGDVIYASLDTDKHKYPIGSGRVTFSSSYAYFKAIDSAFLEIQTSKFKKKIQIDPYLEDSPCSMCYTTAGPYFCREKQCFSYYCSDCWQSRHSADSGRLGHRSLTRIAPRQSVSSTSMESPLSPTLSSSSWFGLDAASPFDGSPSNSSPSFFSGRYAPIAPQVVNMGIGAGVMGSTAPANCGASCFFPKFTFLSNNSSDK